jgi:hypothetical protein
VLFTKNLLEAIDVGLVDSRTARAVSPGGAWLPRLGVPFGKARELREHFESESLDCQ